MKKVEAANKPVGSMEDLTIENQFPRQVVLDVDYTCKRWGQLESSLHWSMKSRRSSSVASVTVVVTSIVTPSTMSSAVEIPQPRYEAVALPAAEQHFIPNEYRYDNNPFVTASTTCYPFINPAVTSCTPVTTSTSVCHSVPSSTLSSAPLLPIIDVSNVPILPLSPDRDQRVIVIDDNSDVINDLFPTLNTSPDVVSVDLATSVATHVPEPAPPTPSPLRSPVIKIPRPTLPDIPFPPPNNDIVDDITSELLGESAPSNPNPSVDSTEYPSIQSAFEALLACNRETNTHLENITKLLSKQNDQLEKIEVAVRRNNRPIQPEPPTYRPRYRPNYNNSYNRQPFKRKLFERSPSRSPPRS